MGVLVAATASMKAALHAKETYNVGFRRNRHQDHPPRSLARLQALGQRTCWFAIGRTPSSASLRSIVCSID